MSISQNLSDVQQQIAEAAIAEKRMPEAVKLIAVSKTKPIDLIEQAFAAGQVDFGENRPQELREKHPLLPGVKWHMIGHLQRNKVNLAKSETPNTQKKLNWCQKNTETGQKLFK